MNTSNQTPIIVKPETRREIKFRGISLCDNEFVEGNLINAVLGVYILPFEDAIPGEFMNQYLFEVKPETVGQLTGLLDKNGVEIYEGDIVRTATDKEMEVRWSNRFASFCLINDTFAFSHYFGESCEPSEVVVIRNIHQG